MTLRSLFIPIPSGRDLATRLVRCIAGLTLFGVGDVLLIDGNLGASPWNVFHQGLSELTGQPIGRLSIIVGLLILPAWRLLDQRYGLGTVLNALIIGAVFDLVDPHIAARTSASGQALFIAGGIIVVGLGSGLYISSGLGPGPRDGLMTGLHARFGWPIRRARTLVEITVLALGALLGGTVGIGTVAFALGIGPMAQVALRWFRMRPVDMPSASALNPVT